ncbi:MULTISPECIES: LysR substrate-binding domain-containing protein [unclassified Beijerinckia]|uniref:LysR family transcriptional regulator n=1 Tax=unclassified Beijerinckia TaxID=2638183 RepID=UPI0008982B11|nr:MULTISPECIES: LysR substrate-binding domain-containing protein [unclassified Beijerinckia]MDH7795984.1 LysR family transcriptional regulator of gallate degradation [Beijerinckia sp. GAS462]SEC25053.1 DNA-binding transcriptional regulator, LysR family [Beijerinckia sp. 28-YEA-48]
MRSPNTVPSLRRLRAFDAAAQTNSLSRAAQMLRLTQPALTHSIAQLEAELGTRLFSRGPEGAFLNEAGHIFQKRSIRFFAQIRSALSTIDGKRADEVLVEQQVSKLASAQMRSLLAIWHAGSFRAAARALRIAEPSLQRPARDLEQIVGTTLYRRSAAGLTVNETGAELARRLALAIGEIRSGAEEIGAASDARASLRIGVLALAPRLLLAKASSAVLTEDDTHRIEVIEAPYAQIARELNDGALDLVFGALRAPPPYTDLIEEPFFEDPYTIVCRRDHPLADQKKVTPTDLARFDWLHPTVGLPRRDVLDQLATDWGLPMKVQFETNCLTTITSLLASSDRLSILSKWHIELDDRLVSVNHPPIPHAPREVGLTFRRNWLPTPFQAQFLASLRHEARERAMPESATSRDAMPLTA